MSNNKRYVAIMYQPKGQISTIVAIIDRRLIGLELQRKIHDKYQITWLDTLYSIGRNKSSVRMYEKIYQLTGKTL